MRLPGWIGLLVVSCSAPQYNRGDAEGPYVAFPTPIAEGKGEPSKSKRQGPNGALRSDKAKKAKPSPEAEHRRRYGSLPDPEPLMLAEQWDYEVVYASGALRVRSVALRKFPKPVATARRMGRYAIELWIGRELIDRVRFDFPLLASEPVPSGPRRPLHEPPSLASAELTQRVLVPASPRATRALLVDRASGEATTLAWPPHIGAEEPAHGQSAPKDQPLQGPARQPSP
jgi:hypothetical protein